MTAVGAKIAPANNNELIKRCVRNMIISSNRKWIKSLATNNYVLTALKCMSHSAHAPNHAIGESIFCARSPRRVDASRFAACWPPRVASSPEAGLTCSFSTPPSSSACRVALRGSVHHLEMKS